MIFQLPDFIEISIIFVKTLLEEKDLMPNKNQVGLLVAILYT